MLILSVIMEAPPACTPLVIEFLSFSTKSASVTLSLLLLMGKDVTSIADNYYLHIKLIGGNSQSNHLHKNFHQFLLEGRIKLSEMSSGNAMYQCIMGDEDDGVPGIQHVAPGFGRKTALKLLKKHGSLENLLNAAAVRTVGGQYVQDALTKYADFLRRNYEILSLRSLKRSGCLTEIDGMIQLFYQTFSNCWEKPRNSLTKIHLILQMVRLQSMEHNISEDKRLYRELLF